MNFFEIYDLLPDSVKEDIVDTDDVKLKSGENAIRITLGKVLTPSEIEDLKCCDRIVGADCVATHRYAPEIKQSYFYVITD